MDESEALGIARGAVQSAVMNHGDDKEGVIQVLQEMAKKDPRMFEELRARGLKELSAAQAAIKH